MQEKLYKTILINLDKDRERLDYVSRQLNEIKLPFERFSAVNGKEYLENGGQEYDEEKAIKELGLKLKPGEIGCALSHKRCYENFLNDREYENTKYLLILEDDITINKDFKNILEREIKKNEKEYKWNYLQFSRPDNTTLQKVFDKAKQDFIWNIKMLKRAERLLAKLERIPYLFLAQAITITMNLRYWYLWNNNRSYRYILRNETCTGGYLIDKKVARILLKLTEKIFYPADGILYKYLPRYKSKDMNFYFYTPIVIDQNNIDKFGSSIDSLGKR